MDHDRLGAGDPNVRLPAGHDRRAVAEMRGGKQNSGCCITHCTLGASPYLTVLSGD